jgi:hypothetical protein
MGDTLAAFVLPVQKATFLARGGGGFELEIGFELVGPVLAKRVSIGLSPASRPCVQLRISNPGRWAFFPPCRDLSFYAGFSLLRGIIK